MEIRRIKKSEWEKLQAFNVSEYGPDHILANKVYYDWQFSNIFNGDRYDYTTLGVFHKAGELVGTLGMFNLPYDYGGRRVLANCLANLIVKEDFRNLGYGFLLLEKAVSFNDLAIDHTINSAAMPLFTKMGWRIADVKRFIYVIDPEKVGIMFGLSMPTVLSHGMASAEDKIVDLSFEPIERFGPVVDSFWDSVKEYYPITVKRSLGYLNWRYAEHPLTRYSIFLAKSDSRIQAFVVLRFEYPKNEDGLIGFKVGRIIDFVSRPETAGFVLRKVTAYCAENGAHLVDFFSSGDFHHRAFTESGFVDVEDTTYSSIPILFNPVSTKRMKLNFAVKLLNNTLSESFGYDLSNWYTTKGDGDQDRP